MSLHNKEWVSDGELTCAISDFNLWQDEKNEGKKNRFN